MGRQQLRVLHRIHTGARIGQDNTINLSSCQSHAWDEVRRLNLSLLGAQLSHADVVVHRQTILLGT
jgi:hypothetical protein